MRTDCFKYKKYIQCNICTNEMLAAILLIIEKIHSVSVYSKI